MDKRDLVKARDIYELADMLAAYEDPNKPDLMKARDINELADMLAAYEDPNKPNLMKARDIYELADMLAEYAEYEDEIHQDEVPKFGGEVPINSHLLYSWDEKRVMGLTEDAESYVIAREKWYELQTNPSPESDDKGE